jgi:hypothetical protein
VLIELVEAVGVMRDVPGIHCSELDQQLGQTVEQA